MLRKVLSITLLLMIGILPAAAQDSSPFMQMLARIPNTPAAQEYFSYVDYHAIFAERPDTPAITSWQQFSDATSTKDQGAAQLMAALMAIRSGPDFYARSFQQAKDFPTTVGFDIFAVDQGVQYGNPPASVTLLTGNFDQQAVIAAHEARGYTETQASDLTLLCGANGCDGGAQLDMQNINRANPFGGDLGRSQPVLVGKDLIASSPDLPSVQAVADTAAGKGDSLADVPDYHAAAAALTANRTLLQADFIAPTDIAAASADQMGASAPTPAELVPQYSLIAIADTVTDTEQQTLVALVYPNEADAQAAAALFPAHLTEATSQRTKQSFADMLAARGMTSADTSVFSDNGNRYVTVLTLQAPIPDINVSNPRNSATGLLFAVLTQAYRSRDLGWLATQP